MRNQASARLVCRSSSRPGGNSFRNGVKVSPDSLCALSGDGETNCVQLFELDKLGQAPTLSCAEGDSLYDYCWWPLMDSRSPPTCCFAATSKGKPVHLWDAYTGQLRASYRPMDSKDEVDNTVSIAFSTDGAKLFAGVKSGVYIFDVRRPGEQEEFLATKISRKSRQGQGGIISALTSCPMRGSLLAVGSYDGTVGIYDTSTRNSAVLQAPLTPRGAGVSQLKFSPCGKYLFAGKRAAPDVVQWDTRMMGGQRSPVHFYRREARGNQRICFDIDANGTYMVTGSTCGKAIVYALSGASDTEVSREALFSEQYPDPVNGVSFSSALVHGDSCFALATGERQLSPAFESDSDDDEANFKGPSGEKSNLIALYTIVED